MGSDKMSKELSDTSVMYGGSNKEREENEVLLLCVNFNPRDSVSICVSLTNSKRKITFKLSNKIFFLYICTVHPAIFKVGNKIFENISQEFEVI